MKRGWMPNGHRTPMRPKMLALLALAGLGAGCDAASDLLGEADMGPAEVVLEVADDAVIADLDEMGKDAVCQAVFDAVDRQVPVETKCVLVGLAGAVSPSDPEAGPTVANCQSVQEVCVPAARLGQQALPALGFPDCGLFKGDTSGCDTTTIGEFRACLNLMADTAVGAIREVITCNLITPEFDPSMTITLPDLEVPEGAEECARVRLGCPGIFEAGGDEGPMMMSEGM